MKRHTFYRRRKAPSACFGWIEPVVIAWLLLGACACSAQETGRAFAGEYTGAIGGSSIRMTLEREGEHITGNYHYTHSGAALRLEGNLQGDRARLQEIYGRRSCTGIITARLGDNGSLSGAWTKPDGSGSLSFRARPLSSAGKAISASYASRRRTRHDTTVKAHRSKRTDSQEIASDATPPGEGRESAAQGTSDFLRAVQQGDAGRARAMLDKDLRLSARDKEGRTALILACMFHSDESAGASFASVEERQEFVRFLLSQGADPNASDKRGYTPLMYAAASWGAGDPIVRMLVDAGADVNARNMYKGTALMIATGKYGNVSTVQLLTDAGADVNLKDKFGHTALSFAKSHHAPASVRVLEKAGAVE